MHYQLADLFEALCDANPDAPAVTVGDRQVNRAELDARANRLAHHLQQQGVGSGDHVGVYAYSRIEWLEALLACWKIRATAVNINYRYVSHELRYMWENADMVALIYEQCFAPLVDELRDDFPGIRSYLWLEDGSDTATPVDTPYEDALRAQTNTRGFDERSDDDIFLIYTGGTTGMPKGVMWRHYDFYHNMVCGNQATEEPENILRNASKKHPMRSMTLSPLMHGGGQFAVIATLLLGGIATIPASRSFDADEILDTVEREGIQLLNIIGDAMARPLAAAQQRSPRNVSSLIAINSGGAILTEAARTLLKESFGDGVRLTGGIGGSEIGSAAMETGQTDKTRGPRFKPGPTMAVLDDELRAIDAGDDRVGYLAMSGFIPVGYYNDPVKSAAVFKTDAQGKRWVIAGDRAQVETDGSFSLVGRDSQCINSGGEKIYVEEVERAIALHPAVNLCAVVGVPDPVWQQRVAAVIELKPDTSLSLTQLQDHCREHIAGYKIPRQLVLTAFRKTPNGKIDYPWAQALAREQAEDAALSQTG